MSGEPDAHKPVGAEELSQLRAAVIFRRIDPNIFDRLISDLEAARKEIARLEVEHVDGCIHDISLNADCPACEALAAAEQPKETE